MLSCGTPERLVLSLFNRTSIFFGKDNFDKFKDPHLFKHPIEGIKGKLGFLKYKGQLPE